MLVRCFTVFFFTIFVLAIFPQVQGRIENGPIHQNFKPSSPFSTALDALQNQIGYTFKSIGFLRRAMTHGSFSEENNKALSVLGASVIEASASLRYLEKNIDISAKVLNLRLSEISKVETSCAVDGMRLGLQKVVRVSSKTNSSAPSVVCGAFRAILGAIAVDTENSNEAGRIFWVVHRGGEVEEAFAF